MDWHELLGAVHGALACTYVRLGARQCGQSGARAIEQSMCDKLVGPRRPFTLHRAGKQLQRGQGSDMGMQPGAMLAYIQEHFPVIAGELMLQLLIVNGDTDRLTICLMQEMSYSQAHQKESELSALETS